MTAPNTTGSPETHPLNDLHTYHRNPRRGDTTAIADSLAANGQYRPIVVNKGTHTGRPMEVLAGNHTLAAARLLAENNPDDERWHTIDCWVIDVDDEAATRIVLADNRTADLGTYNDDTLLQLLESIDHDLDGTGYNYDDLDDLRALAEDTLPEPPTAPTLPVATEIDGTIDPSKAAIDSAPNAPLAEGLSTSHSDADKAATYAERGSRMLVLSYDYDTYTWVVEQLAAYATNHDDCDDSNAAIVIHLLAAANNTPAPTQEP
ncbi:hypothetical protein C1Y63_04810 [Corynebacterium sp. 13CS0277]|uniref:ParB/RepB/Spo0J family partition protein n=1 Tax=Corynebacterium sp. 13CS0277 TaxID=2071994 RepID=UPI000D03EA4B|nr:ParB/RepB/Spo0J family partition protein [Corynebacterium sp. 13CS0277]PRQ11732.1 hypothetical protein C1Y63_04810 [Corynebacterium sp. 13CS0277]